MQTDTLNDPIALRYWDGKTRAATFSEPPALLSDQAHAHSLGLGVVLHDLLTHLATPAGLLVTTAGQCRVAPVVGVHPNGAGPDLARQRVRLGQILGPDARRETIFGVVGELGDRVEIVLLERLDADHRAKDLLAHH